MTVVAFFPLLRLPTARNNALLRVIRLIELDGIIILSLISKKCKDLVVSLKLKTIQIEVYIRDYIAIGVNVNGTSLQICFYLEQTGFKKYFETPDLVFIDFKLDPFKNHGWYNNNLGLKDWFHHIQALFNDPMIGLLAFHEGSLRFDIYSLREIFSNVEILTISNTGCNIANDLSLKKFSPVDDLGIRFIDFITLKHPQNLLIQNFEAINIMAYPERTILTLEDFLLINSKHIYIDELQMAPKEFNKFIKLWMKGSNPRMERLLITYNDGSDQDAGIIMNGIKHEKASVQRKLVFKSYESRHGEELNGGFDIVRKDGMRATVVMDKEDDDYRLEMFVWFDHCFGQKSFSE